MMTRFKIPCGPHKERMWAAFERLNIMNSYVSGGMRYEPRVANGRLDVFAHHTQVFILADKYGMHSLVNMALGKLHRCLVRLPLDVSGTSDAVALLQFCYKEERPQRLRELVMFYTAC